ncbi:hypothetical protein HBO07_11840 [Pseudomonas proteolytica]|uniref:hypothetical protein n=1 Tax=Pseudomonas proteolytica TaxID=219574 RepID=UPI001473632B|nr:hypothetical protein [Pseudomonas proteolytica]NMZ11973.1 hypothetical protein [Pseudomonas proteolytica]
MTTKKLDSGEKGAKAGGAASVTIYRGGVEERTFNTTDLWLFPSAIRIEGDNEWVLLYYPSTPGPGDHEWGPDSRLRGTYNYRDDDQNSTFDVNVRLKVRAEPYQQDGSFELRFGTELRVTGIFTADGKEE